ncbi:MAG: chromosomal replication initiator protein DnaA [Bacteroidetes bacterium]|nr:chromosomal replication initiator protein DnaA [Bacteroidota bacterium]
MKEKTAEQVWSGCLEIIKDNVSPQNFKTWFDPIKPVKINNNTLTIQVPSQFFYEWIEEHYITLLKKVIKKEIGSEGKLEYNIVMENNSGKTETPITFKLPTLNSSTKNPSVNMPADVAMAVIKNPFVIPGLKKVQVESQLNPNYSFENLVEGECNRLARSAGYAAAQKPGTNSYNPLLIFGGVGLGKTHIAQAVGIEVKRVHPNKTVLYVQSEKFITQFIEATKNNNLNDFVHFYQMIDVLIIDDVQYLAGKEKTQDAFFHIFNHLHQLGKQIILTADRAPVDIQGIEQRLLSRFKWGLSAEVTAPDLATRMAILDKKVYNEGIQLPKEVNEYLAYSITSNVRELEGALISLLAQSSLNKKIITLDLAKNMIDKFVKSTAREVSIDYIQKVVCDYFDLAIDTMKSKTRKREVVQARQIAMYFAKSMTKSSLATIGMHCGGKDHATVLHACRTVNNLMDTDKRFKAYIEELEKKISISN